MQSYFSLRALSVAFLCVLTTLSGNALAEQPLSNLLDQLKSTQQNKAAAKTELLAAIAIIDSIVKEHPASDAAVSILLSDSYEGIDFSSFAKRLEEFDAVVAIKSIEASPDIGSSPAACVQNAIAENPNIDLLVTVRLGDDGAIEGVPELVAPATPDTTTRQDYFRTMMALEKCAPFDDASSGVYRVTVPSNGEVNFSQSTETDRTIALEVEDPVTIAEPDPISPELQLSSPETEQAMDLKKQDIRDIQARLLVIGHDPNGVDGAIGKGTRAAIRSWQSSVPVESSGYLNQLQRTRLKEESQTALEEWLTEPDNKQLYEPPPPIALGPSNMSGTWRYTSNCGANSRIGKQKITGVLSMKHVGGNRYKGTLKNSQGLNGRVDASLSGRTVSGVVNFGFLFGKVDFRDRVDDHRLVMRGKDSNGCSSYAYKS